MMQEKSLHTQRVTVWCDIMHDRDIGPYVFKRCQRLLMKKYRNMLNTLLAPVFEKMDTGN